MSTTPRATSRFHDLIEALRIDAGVEEDLLRIRHIPPRDAEHADLDPPLPPELSPALKGLGVDRLYSHQAEAISAVRAGRHTVIVTRTASGKSLCYQIPILESLIADPGATALLMFPTKALAQDQLRSFRRVAELSPDLDPLLTAGTYDGDTTGHTRRKLRDQGNVILTNPDMLHRGILPYHSRWFRFLERLRYVVIDELHTYRGIFGSHVAQVLRRLRRVLDHYDIHPTFVMCSATIGNPAELAARLLGEDVHLVDRDGAPAGARTFVFWNPPYKDATRLERRSSNVEGQRWLVELVKRGIPSIVFAKTRVTSELIYRYAADALRKEGRGLSDKIRSYRGGYLPKERREIEGKLFSGDLLGVVSTNALELGIDVGSLEAAVLVGFPPTIASTWQRAGRAGRSREESLVVILAYNEPVDQYLVRRPTEVLEKNAEHGVVDLENPYILASQLACAANELPLTPSDTRYFGETMPAIAGLLEEEERLHRLEGSWYWSGADFPAARVSLRNISDDTYTIMSVSAGYGAGRSAAGNDAGRKTTGNDATRETRENEVIGTVDASSALELLYPEAIYLHGGRTYYVRELDLEQKVAFVEPREVDYYTQSIVDDRIRVEAVHERRSLAGETFSYGDVEVKWATVAFKKIQFYHLDAIGYHALDLPYQELHTTAFWYAPSPAVAGKLKAENLSVREALAGLRNVLSHLVPRHVMCDRQDLGTTLEASNVGLTTLYVYDRYPGGLGFAEKGFELLADVLAAGLNLIGECPCRTGCPSCVGVPPLDPARHDDPEVRVRPAIPGKAATRRLLELLGERPE